jgi:hypothetical protein
VATTDNRMHSHRRSSRARRSGRSERAAFDSQTVAQQLMAAAAMNCVGLTWSFDNELNRAMLL